MMILVTSGPQAGQVFRLGGDGGGGDAAAGPITIGRQGNLPLADSRASRRHCRLRVDKETGGWVVEDLDSVNGTHLNGRRIEGPEPVGNGDTLRVGRTTLVLAGLAAAESELASAASPAATTAAPTPAAASAPTLAAASTELPAAPDVTDDEDQVASAPAGAIVPANQGSAIVRRAEPTALASPAPGMFDHDGGAPRVVRRWLPAVVLGVLLLALGAMAMLYVRFSDSLERMDRSVAAREQRDQSRDTEILTAIERQIGARSQADRTVIMQEIATLLHEQNQDRADQQDLIRELVLEMRAPSAELQQQQQQVQANAQQQQQQQQQPSTPGAAEQAREVPAAAAVTASDVSPAPAPAGHANGHSAGAGGMTGDPDVIFFVDATGALAGAWPLVGEELSRELVRLDLDQQAWVMLLTAGGAYQFRADFVGRMAKAPTWDEALAAVPEGGVSRLGQTGLRDLLTRAVSSAPHELFVLSDTLGGPDGEGGGVIERRLLRQAIQELNVGEAVRIHAIQFFGRAGREDMKELARENGGTYSYIPAPSPGPTAATASQR